ncbi:O-antigen ligase family protein [Leeuwenhoekiella sp. MAR_2009_132]|uniref:O-antigen ligase family protein n=1 Tax=Leeuwenhoekiella sp. MAR_2009_132 TaxID=1392489 RepID=UPI00048D14F4|nr:O-antigen ligase family protein [Leeuwenhoekiella sp. MAR_2009_132]
MSKFSTNYNKIYIQLIALHVAIGFAIYLFRFLGIIYFLGSIVLFVIWIFQTGNKQNQVLVAASYMTAGEVFFRMTGGSIIPWEAGKYSVICFILIGLFFSGTSRKSAVYWLYLLLLIPGVIYAASTLNFDTNVRNAIMFNLSGPFCLGIAALYCYDRRVSREQLHKVVWALLMPVISLGSYLYFYTPDTREVLNGTGSNFALSGGYGPNQVATALGIGMFALAVQLFVNGKNKLIFFINLAILMFLTYRGIITFSRGGIFTAAIISVVFIFFYFQGVSKKKKNALSFYMLVLGIAIATTWFISSVRTMGLIDLRYANKDAAGRIKEDISTGREELITSELTFFVNNPIMGIGVGKTREYREEKLDILAASHNELSRLLSEHGIFGLFALMILIIAPLFYRIGNRKNYLFYSFFGFWFLTINHSSMRIAAPAFLYALALLNVVDEKKNTLHRKQISD